MTPTTTASSRQCWECLRRNRACDGSTPVCASCSSMGIVCPGYKDQKPLTWLPMGKVSRLQNARSVSGKSKGTRNKSLSPKTGKRGKSSLTVAALSPGERLNGRPRSEGSPASPSGSEEELDLFLAPNIWHEEWESIKILDTWNTSIIKTSMPARQIVPPDAHTGYITYEMFQMMRPSFRHATLALVFGFHVIAAAQHQLHGLDLQALSYTSGPMSGLWTRFYRQIGFALNALGEEIKWYSNDSVYPLFSSVRSLLGASILVSHSLHFRPHARGFLDLVKYCGGFECLMASPTSPRHELRASVIIFTVFNTTSPRNDQLAEVSHFDIDLVNELYEVDIVPFFYCPPILFLDIIRINRLRLQVAVVDTLLSPVSEQSYSSWTPSTEPQSICSLLQHIDSCSLRDWIDALPKGKEYGIIASIFRSAVALYGSLTVPCASEHRCRCKELKKHHYDNLFRLLKSSVDLPVRPMSVFWPLLVAGVAAKTAAEGALVQRHLTSLGNEPSAGVVPFVALSVLKKFWLSGKTDWDECFDRPYGLIL
ncbi:Phomenoic acid biosynthesis cluster-specific transcriptional regulator-like protein [Cladobotryum mycophilum]|uniref:Phomenoic acid biosynthesis cluster-specific transcriptional regulator-like protein n=1 Tax=Cladobotryum mycophilum TaxID=491253 RepID=A0ABR0SKW1_9HYPO